MPQSRTATPPGLTELDPLEEEIIALIEQFGPIPTDIICRQTGHCANEVGAAIHHLRWRLNIIDHELAPRGLHRLAVTR